MNKDAESRPKVSELVSSIGDLLREIMLALNDGLKKGVDRNSRFKIQLSLKMLARHGFSLQKKAAFCFRPKKKEGMDIFGFSTEKSRFPQIEHRYLLG